MNMKLLAPIACLHMEHIVWVLQITISPMMVMLTECSDENEGLEDGIEERDDLEVADLVSPTSMASTSQL